MRIRLLTITHKMPDWLKTGFNEYVKRLPPHFVLELVEIPAEKRLPHSNLQKITEKEGEKLLAATKPGHKVIALDVQGKAISTEDLAMHLESWQQLGVSIDLLVGGPDGLSAACLAKAEMKWSLSALTFPHFLVRLIVAEQVYRAFSILNNHPYHR